MANYVGNCIGCGNGVDRDDPTVLVVHGSDRLERVLVVACSWDCLEGGARSVAQRHPSEAATPSVTEPGEVVRVLRTLATVIPGWCGMSDQERLDWALKYQRALDGLAILLHRIPKP